MGKAKKMKVSKAPRNLPLGDHIQKDNLAKTSTRTKDRSTRHGEEDEEFVDGKLSRQILTQARMQLQEMEDEQGSSSSSSAKKTNNKKKVGIFKDDEDSDDSEAEELDGKRHDFDGRALATDLRINPRDEEAFDAFRNKESGPRRTLADIIMEKINEKKTEIDTQFTDAESLARKELDPRVVEMYQGVGKVMAKYRSGKVPKAFKVIPQFRNWEELALLTEPDKWSAAAVFRATRIFVSGLQEKMAQRFFHLLLLPRVRDDIDTYQRLNFHLYQSLRKALFKPGAFFKGFLLPLCESGDCTLREATIIGSVLARSSIPILHSAAVMLKIAEMEYSGANSIFLRVFLDKKYALPYRVVDALVFHFLRFRTEKRELPVLWHQALLTFSQRYKGHVSSEQRDALLDLIRTKQQHPKITPEIRRELVSAPCRDLKVDEPMAAM